LEEDVDMRGFLPLKKLMVGEEKGEVESKGEGNKAAAQVHPNEEQLMRIADLLNDAKLLTEFEVRKHFLIRFVIFTLRSRIHLWYCKTIATWLNREGLSSNQPA
jgi:hypothetical protein